MPDGVYRGAKLLLAFTLMSAGVVRCPCRSGAAWVVGAMLGATLYVLLARSTPIVRPSMLATPTAWAALLGAAADELLWRGWLVAPAIRPGALPYAVGASILGFALTHFPRQGLRGVATHLFTGSVFAAAMLSAGLLAAVTAHTTYNLCVLMARAQAGRAGEGAARDGA